MIELKRIVEAMLFAADRPLAPADVKAALAKAAEQTAETDVRTFRKVKLDEIERALHDLAAEIDAAGRSYRLVCVAGAWQIVVQPEFAPWLRALTGERGRPSRLSLPALETLAIIAYRQPITRAEIEEIRGVSVDGVMQTLLERELIEPAGKADVPGRPTMYVTTKAFLEHFGLPDLNHLPDAEELRRVPVERPAGLVTVEPGLATAPPDQLTAQTAPEQQPDSDAAGQPSPAQTDSSASTASDSTGFDPKDAPAFDTEQSEPVARKPEDTLPEKDQS
ncbi:MAG TPA: SMC-Scp complex subunit ScpB [Verrucomicrobiota bacterium]|nr:SMC-Scp complex subunit ScpB [Verrucomicrobiota bacterium]